MKTWKSKTLVAVLALAASPLFAAPQGTAEGQSSPANPPASNQAQPQAQPNKPGRRHHWRRHRRRHHRRHHRRRVSLMLRNPAIRERLGITTEQAARIQARQSAFVKAMIRDRAEVQVKRLELRELLAAEKPDRAAIEQKLAQLNEVQFAMQKTALEHRLALRELFTLEQRQKMRELFWEMRRGGGRFGPPAPRPPDA